MCTDKMVAIAAVLSVACLHFFDRIIGHSQHFFKGMAAIFLQNHFAQSVRHICCLRIRRHANQT